jgi:hypothetical protein
VSAASFILLIILPLILPTQKHYWVGLVIISL